MMFMAYSLSFRRPSHLAQRHPEEQRLCRVSKDAGLVPLILRGSLALAPQDDGGISLHSRHIELRPLAGAVALERPRLADRVGALKDPVLPRRQAGKDFRFHGLGSDEAQVGFHAGEAVGRKTGALL